MELNISDPKNIVGVSTLLGDDPKLREIEHEISEAQNMLTAEVDPALEYSQNMDRIRQQYELGISDMSFDEPLSVEPVADTFSMPPPQPPRLVPELNTSEMLSRPEEPRYNVSPNDSHLRYITREQEKQSYVDRVMRNIDNESFDISKEIEEDDKNILLEQIDSLRNNLESDGINVSNVAIVGPENSLQEIQNTFKILKLRNDRAHYASAAENLIVTAAAGMEVLFDGERDWFGHKPDLVGWSRTVRMKMRRMRHTTSSMVHDIIKDNSIGPWTLLMIELVPSMFTYSYARKYGAGTQSDADATAARRYSEAQSNLNSQLP